MTKFDQPIPQINAGTWGRQGPGVESLREKFKSKIFYENGEVLLRLSFSLAYWDLKDFQRFEEF